MADRLPCINEEHPKIIFHSTISFIYHKTSFLGPQDVVSNVVADHADI